MKAQETLTMTMDAICGWFDISRQAYYQMRRREQARQQAEALVLEQVKAIRHHHPRMGARKLLYLLQDFLQAHDIHLGRDRFFALLRRHDLLVERSRRRRRTTWPGQWRCENLLEALTVTAVNQVWVSDITYIDTETGYDYLFLITDLYSRRIMGWTLSPSLAAEGALLALQMAAATASGLPEGLIHHSDRGVQYTCYDYRLALHNLHALSSMGRSGHSYENAYAERVNGILKLEYGLDACFGDSAQAFLAVQQAVSLYNEQRPHLSLQYRTPMQVYTESASRHDDTLAEDDPLVITFSTKGSAIRNGSEACSPSPGVPQPTHSWTQGPQLAALSTPAPA